MGVGIPSATLGDSSFNQGSRIVFSREIFRVRYRVLALASLIALAGCHFQTDPPGDAPRGVAVAAGDGRVTVTWNQEPDLTYWIFYQAGSSVVPAVPGVPLVFDVVSPRVVAGLANGAQYAFTMNATKNDSRAGPSSPIVLQTPRLAGATWNLGTALGAANLNGIAFSGTRLVVVGDSATILAGDYNYTSANPLGVTAWMPPTSLPAGFPATTSFSAVTFSGQFVALGADGSVLTSADGLTWTPPGNATNPVLSAGVGMNGIVFGSSLYVAVGNGGKIFTSADLVTWNQSTSNTMEDLYSVSFLNGGFVTTGANGTLLTSPDGGTWTAQTSNTPNALRGATFSATPTALYVVVGDAGAIVTSTDGVTWNPIAPPLAANLRAVVFGSRFMAVGQGGAVAYSDDGSSWAQTSAGSSDLARVLFAPGMYIAVGAAGANVFSK